MLRENENQVEIEEQSKIEYCCESCKKKIEAEPEKIQLIMAECIVDTRIPDGLSKLDWD